MVQGIEHDSQVDHFERTGNHAGFAAEASEPVPLRHVVALDQVGLRFGLNEQLRRDQIAVSAPAIRKENLDVPTFQPFIEP